LIAEEVAEVNPDLVVRDDKGEIYTVRYDAVNAMLLNEFLKEHRKVEQQAREMQEQQATIAQQRKDSQAKSDKLEATIAQQQKEMQGVIARLNEQAAQIQKVSTQLATASPSRGGLEVSKPAPRTVSNK
jgi:septal ring factor EnvC (AmiA/AmiB activator)